jgi:hypothetical protein
MNKKESDSLRQRKSRDLKKGLTSPCTICESTQGPHLHSLEKITHEQFELLCQLNGKTFCKRGMACCLHFEPHEFTRPSKKYPLVVKTDFATPFFITPPLRPVPSKSPLPPRRIRKPQPPTPLTIPELLLKIDELTEEVKYWKTKYEEEQVDNAIMVERCDDLMLTNKHNEIQIQDYIFEHEKEKMAKQKEVDGRFLGLIGPPYVHSRFWLGITKPIPLIEEWKPYITSKWEIHFLFSSFMVWMRRGLNFTFLSHFIGKSITTIRRQFYALINDLYPWALKKIEWPKSVEEWRLTHHEKLRQVYPKTLFFWVDGTVVKTWCPKDSKTARVFYNKKHEGHAYVFFVTVTPDGKIVFVSDCMSGTEHDKTH